MKIVAIGADHAGFDLKEHVKTYLAGAGYQVQDMGCFSKDSVDYPDYARLVAQAVAAGEAQAGVLICNTGIGMSIAANKFSGIRAALVTDIFSAQMSRRHNDANVLVLGAGRVDQNQAIPIVQAWFASAFEGGRHARRVGKISEFEFGGHIT